MNPTLPSATPATVLTLLKVHRKLWLAPTVACGLLASLVALTTPRTWEATQALVVRQEAASSRTAQPGKFSDLYEMRTLQETILEVARSRQVIANTVETVEAKLSGTPARPVTDRVVEEFRDNLRMLPPGGAEFGKTEVFYFSVKDASRERAIALVDELTLQLDKRLGELLSERAASLVAELGKQLEASEATLAERTKYLSQLEGEIGADLGELRMLHSAFSGQSDLRQQAVSLENDARAYQIRVNDSEELLRLLRTAVDDPEELVAMPSSLLVAQPALQQLQTGLIRTQLLTARTRGTRSDEHPRVQSALEAEKRIRADMQSELATAIESTEAELQLGRHRYEVASQRLKEVNKRLTRLAESRVEYSNRVAAVEKAREAVELVRQNLGAAQGAFAAAKSVELVSRIDQPETGPNPTGPGRTTIASAGTLAGFLIGMGLVFLQTQPLPARPTRSAPATPERSTSTYAPRPESPSLGTAGSPVAFSGGQAPPEPTTASWGELPCQAAEEPLAPEQEWWDKLPQSAQITSPSQSRGSSASARVPLSEPDSANRPVPTLAASSPAQAAAQVTPTADLEEVTLAADSSRDELAGETSPASSAESTNHPPQVETVSDQDQDQEPPIEPPVTPRPQPQPQPQASEAPTDLADASPSDVLSSQERPALGGGESQAPSQDASASTDPSPESPPPESASPTSSMADAPPVDAPPVDVRVSASPAAGTESQPAPVKSDRPPTPRPTSPAAPANEPRPRETLRLPSKTVVADFAGMSLQQARESTAPSEN
jgi:uncharacterized protein involved in exopolysaccharide biosynthesis